MGGLQAWLQGWPDKNRNGLFVALGNLLSDVRYWAWRARGRRRPS